jgi:ER lumen protein retaining receptor
LSMYNTVMKVIFITATALIVYTIHYREPVQSTYDKSYDTFSHWKWAVTPVAVISLITHFTNSEFDGNFQEDIVKFLWILSIYLEAVAIVPQLVLLPQSGECDDVTGLYIFFKGAYRGLYILNWLQRYYRHNRLVFNCGVVQTLVYVIFFSCIYRSNASLRHKKDDSQPPPVAGSEMEEPLLLRETPAVDAEAMIDLPDLHHHTGEQKVPLSPLADNQELVVV